MPTWRKWLIGLSLVGIIVVLLVVFVLPSTPDLVVQSITCSPESPIIGQTVKVTIMIENKGNGDASSSSVCYFIDGEKKGNYSVILGGDVDPREGVVACAAAADWFREQAIEAEVERRLAAAETSERE